MKTPEEFCEERRPSSDEGIVACIAERDAEWQSRLVASETALRVAVEHATELLDENERLQARLDEAVGLLTTEWLGVADRGRFDCWWQKRNAFLASVESPGVAGAKMCVKCLGRKIDRKGRPCHYCSWKVEPVPAGNAGAGNKDLESPEREIGKPAGASLGNALDPVGESAQMRSPEAHESSGAEGAGASSETGVSPVVAAPAPKRDVCSACRGKGYFRANGYPCDANDPARHAPCGLCST